MADALKPIQVSIKNFQSIESLDLEVSGFTCITGKSNIGKSAVIRAIAGAILNVPVGPHVRKGAKFCSVTLRSEQSDFKWEKGGGASRYFVPSDADKPMDKVGAGQIEHVARMGFAPVKLGREETYPWYATQFEPLFLLTETGATVTDFISEVSRLQVLQDAITISIRGKKKALDEAKVRTADLETLRGKAAKVSDVPEVERIVRELDEQAESIREYERRVVLGEECVRRLALAHSILQAIEAVSGVKIPDLRVGDGVRKIRLASRLNRDLMAGAQKVIAVKAIGQVKVPEVPSDEVDRLRRANRFSFLPAMKEVLLSLRGIEKAAVPVLDDSRADVLRLRRAGVLTDKLGKLNRAIGSLGLEVDIPEPPPSPEHLSRMSGYQKKLEAGRREVDELERKAESARKELLSIQVDMDKIPSCPTCGRVTPAESKTPHSYARLHARA